MDDFNNPNGNNNEQQNNVNTDQNANQQQQYQQPQQNQYQQPQYQQPQYSGQSQYQQPQNNQYQQTQQNQNQYQQNPYQQTPYQQSYQQYQAPKKLNGMALASVICGGFSFLLGCCLFFLTLPASIAGIITGILSLKNSKDNKNDRTMAIVGIVLSSIGALVSILMLIACIVGLANGNSWSNSYDFNNLWDYYY